MGGFLAVAVGILFLLYDVQISIWAQSIPNAHLKGTFWWFVDKYGEYPTWILAILSLLIYLFTLGKERWAKYRPYLLFLLMAMLISPVFLVQALKIAVHRPRPSVPMLWFIDMKSFPSGHTASAFVLFTFTYFIAPRKRALRILLGIFLGAWGIAVGVARVVWGAHYPSDVLGGALISLVTEYALWKLVFREKIYGDTKT
jgi:undecaprenyl-diphosphatase